MVPNPSAIRSRLTLFNKPKAFFSKGAWLIVLAVAARLGCIHAQAIVYLNIDI